MKCAISLCAVIALLLGVGAGAMFAQDRPERQGPPRVSEQARPAPERPAPQAVPRGEGGMRGIGMMGDGPRGEMRGPGPHYGPPPGRGPALRPNRPYPPAPGRGPGYGHAVPRPPLFRPALPFYPSYDYWPRPYYGSGFWHPYLPYSLSVTVVADDECVACGKLEFKVEPKNALVLIDEHYLGIVQDLNRGVKLPVGSYLVSVYGTTGKQDFNVQLRAGQTIVIRAKLD